MSAKMGDGMLHNWIERMRCHASYVKWLARGRHLPVPHRVKRRTVAGCGRGYGLRTLVETGTYLGDMIEAMRPYFRRVVSIELSRELYEKAAKRFAPYGNVELFHGDSTEVLPAILEKTREPCLFWLDGHYSEGFTARGSKDTPIVEELNHILCRGDFDDVILIDDAAMFNGSGGYPAVGEVERQVLMRRPDFAVYVEDYIIRCHKSAMNAKCQL